MTKRPIHRVSILKSIGPAILIWFFSTLVLSVFAGQDTASDEQCLLQQLKTAQPDITVGAIRELCQPASAERSSVVPAGEGDIPVATEDTASQKLTADRKAIINPFSILAHKPNYFLFAAYNYKGWDPSIYREVSNDPDYKNQHVEAQFQISLKVPLALDLFAGRVDIYGAYTNRSFWQMYNRSNSEPFRETNHEPELWLQFENDWQVLGFTNILNSFGFVHQSNGLSGQQSRSWNRLYANFLFEKDDWVLNFKPWIWITQDWAPTDNPDITDYLGHGEFRTAWRRDGNVYSVMIRNQLESGFKRGAVELGWSFPVFDYPYLKGYVQYFYGYGESLIDYNSKVNRLGIGLSLTDWLD